MKNEYIADDFSNNQVVNTRIHETWICTMQYHQQPKVEYTGIHKTRIHAMKYKISHYHNRNTRDMNRYNSEAVFGYQKGSTSSIHATWLHVKALNPSARMAAVCVCRVGGGGCCSQADLYSLLRVSQNQPKIARVEGNVFVNKTMAVCLMFPAEGL